MDICVLRPDCKSSLMPLFFRDHYAALGTLGLIIMAARRVDACDTGCEGGHRDHPSGAYEG
jgi:hypothetical protein